jgi:hypothetical protein
MPRITAPSLCKHRITELIEKPKLHKEQVLKLRVSFPNSCSEKAAACRLEDMIATIDEEPLHKEEP